jgi:hypothetical protein
MSDMRVVQSLDKGNWRRFVDDHPEGSIFHTPEMFEVFSRVKGFRPTLWAVVDDRYNPLALFLPTKITLIGGLFMFLTTRATVFASALTVPGPVGEKALNLLLEVYNQEVGKEVLYTKLRNVSNMAKVQSVLQEHGFEYKDHVNYLIDLTRPADVIFANINKSGRSAVRRSQRRGVVPKELRHRSQIPAYYDLLLQTHLRANFPLADVSLFYAVYDILVPKGMAKMMFACVDDQYAAASLEMPFKDVIYSWYSGYDSAFSKTCPNDFLVWYILEWGAQNGYSCFDFGGAGAPGEPYSPRDFKAKFGGQLVNYGINIRVHAPVRLMLSRMLYQIYKRVTRYRSDPTHPVPAPAMAVSTKGKNALETQDEHPVCR